MKVKQLLVRNCRQRKRGADAAVADAAVADATLPKFKNSHFRFHFSWKILGYLIGIVLKMFLMVCGGGSWAEGS